MSAKAPDLKPYTFEAASGESTHSVSIAGRMKLPSFSKLQLSVLAAACLIAASLRLIELPVQNLSCVVALALLCGSVVRHPMALLLPVGVRLLTDVALHFKTGFGFFPSWPFDYSAYAIIFLLGRHVSWKQATAIAGGTVGSVVIYFVLSNFGVWLIWPDTYERSLAGLLECFTMAIPFARGTVFGNFSAASLFFGAWYMATSLNSGTQPVTSSASGLASGAFVANKDQL